MYLYVCLSIFTDKDEVFRAFDQYEIEKREPLRRAIGELDEKLKAVDKEKTKIASTIRDVERERRKK